MNLHSGDSRDSLHFIKNIMSMLNLIILIYFSVVIHITLQKVTGDYLARNFLDNITYLPSDSIKMTLILFVAFFSLVAVMELRGMATKGWVSQLMCALEVMLCVVIIRCVYVGYNGIILLVIADVVTTIRGRNYQGLFVGIMGMMYALADYDVISIGYKTISFQEFLEIYTVNQRMLFTGVKNILISLNIILFIFYIIVLMQSQMKEKIRVSVLNEELQRTNKELQEMNEQLKDYAVMQKKMGEVEERNRIAREIHDTLGHTMTGLSAGIDACIALIDYSVEETKKQLQVISGVARQGLQDIRRSMNKLRPDALEKHSLEGAIEKLIVETMETSDVLIQYVSSIDNMRFKEDEEDTIYRIVQEGITNAIRHGKATKIYINFKKLDNMLVLRIRDNGIGCPDIQKGFGLTHMNERVQMLHGTIRYDGSHGFQLIARIPIRWGEKND